MRLIVQSVTTGAFLCPSQDGGEPVWIRDMKKVGGGVVTDWDQAMQLAMDHADLEERPQIVDLDRLGTLNDY